jgi:hypothetical protein
MRSLFLCAVLAVWPLACAHAEPIAELYRARAFVTGERVETRDPALRQGFADVMVKVSGDPRLLAGSKLDAAFDPSAVLTYSYRDLMAGIPKHDEQGTRDRPFELTVDYVPEKIDAALAALGRKAWGEERPRLLLLIGVELGPSRFIIADEGEPGSVQRQALIASARRYGLPVVFPTRAEIDASGLTPNALKQPDPAALAAIEKQAGADRVFAGHMRFSDQALGWIAEWRLPDGAATTRWGIEGVNFDEAFRNAIRGSVQVLSGNGAP